MADEGLWWLIPLGIGAVIVGGVVLSSLSKKSDELVEDLSEGRITKNDLNVIHEALGIVGKLKKLQKLERG